jgi:hypothetical protein
MKEEEIKEENGEENNSKQMDLSGRLFTASVKPAWPKIKIDLLMKEMTGVAVIWAINHDKDTNEEGEIIENHTHFVIEYETPRKISTLAKLLGCEPNFIILGKSKKALIRYLTHLDDSSKHRYDPEEVLTNSGIPYAETVLGAFLTDRQIADLIREGKGYDLLGVVSTSKLRTIQAFLQYDVSGRISRQLAEQGEMIGSLMDTIGNIENRVDSVLNDFSKGFTKIGADLVTVLMGIREEAKLARINKITKR